MYNVSIRNLSKGFGKVPVLQGIDLEIKKGELFFLLGPSGCGKTTLLRILAGFETADTGQVLFNDQDVTSLPAQKRSSSLVFQNYALWPHMSVAENIAFGLENLNLGKKEIEAKVESILGLVRLAEFKDRMPGQLSGGQQQRVALARALVVEPQLILLDEPLSNLDARLRAEMRIELLALLRKTAVTAVYVTHDQEEALSLADRMAFMDGGKIVQMGTPRDLYDRPMNCATARFLGNANIFQGTVNKISGEEAEVETPLGLLAGIRSEALELGGKAYCFFRPERMNIAAGQTENAMRGKVLASMFEGNMEHLYLEQTGVRFEALIPAPASPTPTGKDMTFFVAKNDMRILAQ